MNVLLCVLCCKITFILLIYFDVLSIYLQRRDKEIKKKQYIRWCVQTFDW